MSNLFRHPLDPERRKEQALGKETENPQEQQAQVEQAESEEQQSFIQTMFMRQGKF